MYSVAAAASPLNLAVISPPLSLASTVTPPPEPPPTTAAPEPTPAPTVTVTETAAPAGPQTVVLEGDQFGALIIGLALVVTVSAAGLVAGFRR